MDFTLVNARFVKPLDEKFLASLEQKQVVTLEDNVLAGGFGDAVARALRGTDCNVHSFGFGDVFIPHGEPASLAVKYGLDPEKIYALIEELYARG